MPWRCCFKWIFPNRNGLVLRTGPARSSARHKLIMQQQMPMRPCWYLKNCCSEVFYPKRFPIRHWNWESAPHRRLKHLSHVLRLAWQGWLRYCLIYEWKLGWARSETEFQQQCLFTILTDAQFDTRPTIKIWSPFTRRLINAIKINYLTPTCLCTGFLYSYRLRVRNFDFIC